MRPITKGPEPVAFARWKIVGDPGWNPSYGDLANPQKNEVKASLIAEQGAVCCYCERRITLPTSHIEHLVPQHADPSKDLDYGNLLASCEPETKTSPPRCGHRKDDADLPVHPLLPDCSDYFVFESSGNVGPAPGAVHRDPATRAIELLGLALPEPVAARAKAIEGVIDILTSEDAAFVAAYRASVHARDPQGQFLPFATAVAQFLATYA